MFTVKRFDAFNAASSSGSKDDSVDTAKLDALNERILKKRKVAQEGEGSTSLSLTAAPTSAPSHDAAAATPASSVARPALNIHPSRLNNAPLLRQSVNKARTGPKEKTKAKQDTSRPRRTVEKPDCVLRPRSPRTMPRKHRRWQTTLLSPIYQKRTSYIVGKLQEQRQWHSQRRKTTSRPTLRRART